MKNKLIIIGAFLTLLSSTNFAAETTTIPAQSKATPAQLQAPQPYQSKEGDYSIQLPGGWEMRNGFMGTDVLALSPAKDSNDLFRENISVLVVKVDQPITAEEYYKLNLEGLKKLLTNYNLEKSEHIKVDGVDALKLIYTHQMGEIKAKVAQVLLLKGDKAYVITFSAEPEEFNNFLPQVETVVNSFRFNKAA